MKIIPESFHQILGENHFTIIDQHPFHGGGTVNGPAGERNDGKLVVSNFKYGKPTGGGANRSRRVHGMTKFEMIYFGKLTPHREVRPLREV